MKISLLAGFARHGAILVAACGFTLFGCTSGGGASAELRAQPKPTSFGGRSPGATLTLPGSDGLSITLASSERAAGLAGSAVSDATASKTGSAQASARVESGGTAAARFQLGHAIENDSDQQADFDITVAFDHRLDLSSKPSRQFPDGHAELTLFATQQRTRQTVDQYAVVAQATDQGAGGGSGTASRSFSVTLGPHDVLNVFLSGAVTIECPEDRSAHCDISVNGLTIKVQRKEAPPIGAGSNG